MHGYPEHEKIAKIKDESQLLGDFLDWLQEDKGLRLCKLLNNRIIDNHFAPTDLNANKLIAEFFGIDLEKLEQEKREMLEGLRVAQ